MASSDLFLNALVARFGADNVRVPGDTGAETFTGWHPAAVKARQAGQVVPRPVAVVTPANTEEVAALVRLTGEHNVAVLPVGGGSNTVGSTVPNVECVTVAVSLSRLTTISWDETALSVTAGAGVVLSDLEEMLNKHGVTLGSLPQSARIATVGGAVATNAVGLFAAGYGDTRANTLALEAVQRGGVTVRTTAFGAATRETHHALIGTEGAYGIVTEATFAVRPLPEVRAWCAFTFPRFDDAADALRLIHRSDARPACVRLFDPAAAQARFAGQVPAGHSLLLLAVEGSEVVQTGVYQTMYAVCQQVGGTPAPEIDGDAWHDAERFRTDAFAANGRPGAIADVLSVWSPWGTLTALHQKLIVALTPDTTTLSAQIGYANAHGAALTVHFVAETASPLDALARHERLVKTAQEVALSHGASVAPQWGVGIARREWADAERKAQNRFGDGGFDALFP